MLVYPEIESWNKFYPSEIFIRHEPTENIFSAIKMANIGTTINLHSPASGTSVYKKIGDIVSVGDLDLALFPLSRR